MTRRRYMVVEGELTEIGEYDNLPRNVPVIGDRHYDGLATTDGVDISTRAKHRAYMKQHGLTTVDDFTNAFREAEVKRMRWQQEGYDPTRRADIERAYERAANRKSR